MTAKTLIELLQKHSGDGLGEVLFSYDDHNGEEIHAGICAIRITIGLDGDSSEIVLLEGQV